MKESVLILLHSNTVGSVLKICGVWSGFASSPRPLSLDLLQWLLPGLPPSTSAYLQFVLHKHKSDHFALLLKCFPYRSCHLDWNPTFLPWQWGLTWCMRLPTATSFLLIRCITRRLLYQPPCTGLCFCISTFASALLSVQNVLSLPLCMLWCFLSRLVFSCCFRVFNFHSHFNPL